MCECNNYILQLTKILQQHKCKCNEVEEITEGIEEVVIEEVEEVEEVVIVPKNKKALLIGINYLGSNGELGGCINDVKKVRKMLIDVYNYKNEEVVMLTDETEIKPTFNNIILCLDQISKNLDRYSNVYLHYSGHGASIEDKNKDEKDGKDECLVPLDYEQEGLITDDLIKSIFTNNFNKIKEKCDTNFTVVIDACHSGTILDLKYKIDCQSVENKGSDKNDYLYKDWSYDFKTSQNSKYKKEKKIKLLMISGCRDTQTSADAYINNRYQGALTFHLLKVLELNKYNLKIKYLLKDIHCMLKINGYDQKPVISSGQNINIENNFKI
jgi:hypothetical protein